MRVFIQKVYKIKTSRDFAEKSLLVESVERVYPELFGSILNVGVVILSDEVHPTFFW